MTFVRSLVAFLVSTTFLQDPLCSCCANALREQEQPRLQSVTNAMYLPSLVTSSLLFRAMVENGDMCVPAQRESPHHQNDVSSCMQ